ncbi:fe2+ zn2+ uptake regulation protein [Pseudomonas sp. NPDC007930]|uniref:fe2+ zn2+ uptake regulation protein n=1 Tax=Pseudomonas sp. NPDC007930 TaxID=3364417 RepID=UPI0036E2A3D7
MHDAHPQLPRAQPRPRAGQAHEASAPASNEQIKGMLRQFGLRTSLIRLKVIDALLQAERDGRAIGMRGVHARLAEQAIPLAFLSVREVLKRLAQEGLVSLAPDKTYRLEAAVLSYFEQD